MDLKSTGPQTVRFGSSFLANRPVEGPISIRYNHKPALDHGDDGTATVRTGKRGAASSLQLRDGNEEYEYEGNKADDDCMVVLLPDETGDGYVLERIDAAWTYNMTQAPWQKDREKLAEQYTILDANTHSNDNPTSDEEDLSTTPEADNPFDWRHYFTPASPSTTTTKHARPTSTLPSPAPSNAPTSRQSTPLSRPVKKPVNPMLPNQRKPRQQPAVPPTSSPQHKRQKSSSSTTAVPQVRISTATSRFASIQTSVPAPQRNVVNKRKQTVEDINLDSLDTPITERAVRNSANEMMLDAPSRNSRGGGRGSMAAALSGNLEVEGPISLRSAASSPGSRVGSPAVHGDGDLVMDDVDDDAGEREVGVATKGVRDADMEEADDEDVEDLALPSPVRDRRSSGAAREGRRRSSGVNATGAGGDDADDDDELEAGLMEAMMADDDEGMGGGAVVDEEEESEEE